jgi:hypothetical protein
MLKLIEEIETTMLQLWLIANTVLWPLHVKTGGLELNLSVVVLLISGTLWLGIRRKIEQRTAKILFALSILTAFSWILAFTGPCQTFMLKSISTTPILLFLVALGIEIGQQSSRDDWLRLQKTAVWSLIAAFCGFALELARPELFSFQKIYRAEGKLSGLFQEPSHVAFSLFPCIAILLTAEDRRTKQKGLLALVAILIISRSSTLIALTMFFVLYRLLAMGRARHTMIAALGIVSIVPVVAAIDYTRFVMPTVVRVVGIASPDDTDNLSSLVYVQGWQDAGSNLLRTHGMGLGINMMGCTPLPDVSVRSVLTLQGLGDLNATDGSFLFAKIVSETGVLGIIFYVTVFWSFIKLEKKRRELRKNNVYAIVTVQAALIFCFVASSFIRQAGYFDGGLLLWVVAVGGASA